MMKRSLRLMLCLLGCAAAPILMGPAHAIMGPPPFQATFWSADRILIGTAVSVDGGTAQITAEKYLRDRMHDAPRRIHAERSTQGGCVVFPPQPYDEGSQYLLFMQRLDNVGERRDSYWFITWELRLPIPGFCVDATFGLSPAPDIDSHCEPVVPTEMFLDALGSFDACFAAGTTPTVGSAPASQSCTDEELAKWIARSPIHAWLAEKTLEQIQRQRDAQPKASNRPMVVGLALAGTRSFR